MRRLTAILVLGVWLGIFCHVGAAYDRDAAVDYALTWSVYQPAEVANTTVYYMYAGADCANFVSQCLIAGGIRFRSRESSSPDNDNTTTTDQSELGTGKNTKAIKDGDMAEYSRVISGANYLAQSMLHSRHGGTLYTTPELVDDGDVWQDVQPGDLFMGWNGGSYYHAMFINNVKSTTPKDIYYCAHTIWRRNQKALDSVADWKTSGGYRIICLPDAPTIREFIPYTPTKYLRYARANEWVKKYTPNIWKVGKENLYVYVTFDTDMNTFAVATVQLLLGGTSVTFGSQSGAGYTNGWWTNSGSGEKYQNRTWCGRILAGNLPTDKNGWYTVSIRAQAADGSYNDTHDDLAEYSASSACTLFRIRVDTRRDSGKSDE